jgi:hypothetical protein
VVPPVAVLEDFYTSRPEFILNVDRTVSSSASLDPKEYLSDTEQEMVEVLRSAPDGIMDRSGFIDSCRKRGLNLSTVGVSTTYSPVLERMAQNVWATRGTRISPAFVEVFQDEHAERHPATTASGWSSDGTYWFTVFLNMTHIGSGVISLPPGTPFLYGRAFKAVTAEGRPCGTINSDQRTSWGWNSFYIRSGAEPGDYLRATFDVRSGTVQLELGGPELLEPDHQTSRRLGAQEDEDDEEDEEQPVG